MGTPRLVAGVDCSTQSTKVVVCDAASGAVVREGRASHPDTTEVDPSVWWEAFTRASSGLLDGVAAIAVAGQQHGMVCLDGAGAVVRPALLWNDTRSAGAADDLTAELGGPRAWADAVGSVPVASFTVTKLRWLAAHEPAHAERVASVMLPHDYLTHRIIGSERQATTDRGDASGTGYWSPAAGEYRVDLLRLAFGQDVELPRVAGPSEVVGEATVGAAGSALVAPGTGDNMAAALGLGLQAGDVVVSLGTSGTVFAVADNATADATGAVAGFADATGRFLPLVCTLNAARVLTAASDLLGVTSAELSRLALTAEPGAGGLTLLPYLDGERTPNLPFATGVVAGLTRRNASPANLARAAFEGMLCGLADGLAAIERQGFAVRRVLLTGGAARSDAVQAIAPAVLGRPVELPEPAEYVARGAARQAAWILADGPEPPQWTVSGTALRADSTAAVHRTYADIRDRAQTLLAAPE